MTQAQAREELARLAAGLNHDLRAMSAEEVASWMRVLMAVPSERGRAAVTRLIDTWSYSRFPRRGDFVRVADTLTMEGQPGAGAYSQDRPSMLYDQKRIQRAIEQHDRWLAMSDEEYMDELERLWATGRRFAK